MANTVPQISMTTTTAPQITIMDVGNVHGVVVGFLFLLMVVLVIAIAIAIAIATATAIATLIAGITIVIVFSFEFEILYTYRNTHPKNVMHPGILLVI